MKLYTLLSKIGFLKKSYAFKFLFIAFLGIHIPLIGIIVFLNYYDDNVSPKHILIFTLVLTLMATIITLIVLKKLIRPVEISSKALDLYKTKRLLPDLPTDFTDEAGLLMANITNTIRNSDNLLKQKLDLLYLLSHDLKNFAATPAALAKIILDDKPSDSIAKCAGLILESTERQTEFIESVLTLMQEEEKISVQHVRVKNISFLDIIAVVQQDLGHKLKAKNLTLNIDNDIREVHLKIDQDMLTHVLLNLVDNAIKFSYPGNIITLTVEKNHANIEISVKDDGIGFDNGERNELFRKFTKLRRTGTQNESTTGIGLYLCQQIIKKSEGTIKAESKGENKGATFSVRLKMYRKSHS